MWLASGFRLRVRGNLSKKEGAEEERNKAGKTGVKKITISLNNDEAYFPQSQTSQLSFPLAMLTNSD